MRYFEVIFRAGLKIEQRFNLMKHNWMLKSSFEDYHTPYEQHTFFNEHYTLYPDLPKFLSNTLLGTFQHFYFKKPVNPDEDGISIEISLFQHFSTTPDGHRHYRNDLHWINGDIDLSPQVYLTVNIETSRGSILFEIEDQILNSTTPEILENELSNKLESSFAILNQKLNFVVDALENIINNAPNKGANKSGSV